MLQGLLVWVVRQLHQNYKNALHRLPISNFKNSCYRTLLKKVSWQLQKLFQGYASESGCNEESTIAIKCTVTI